MSRTTNQPLLVVTAKSAGALAENTFVRQGMDKATDGDSIVGVCLEATTASGQYFPLAVAGVISVVAGANITINSLIYSDANGKATSVAVNKPWGIAMEAATAGGTVPVLLGFRGTL